jgi:hypothetical protein
LFLVDERIRSRIREKKNYGSGSRRPKIIRIRILNTACELFLTARDVNKVLIQVTVKEATVNTIVAAEVAGWFFIGKNKGRHSEIALLLVSVFLFRKTLNMKENPRRRMNGTFCIH